MISSAPAAEGHFRLMAITIESIAATSAMFKQDLEVNNVDFQSELMYQATMSIARKMLNEGLMTEEEYRQIDTMFREKYQPKFGTLFVDLRTIQR